MYRFYILPVLALVGIIFVIRTVILGSVPQQVAPPVVEPPKAPYPSFVAGSGIIEASSENIAIASPLSGVVKQVFVAPGAAVIKGQPLFALDDRDAQAEIEVRRAQVERSLAELADSETQLNIYRGVPDERALIRGELLKRQSAAAVARARVLEAQAQLQAAETTLARMTIRSPIDGQVLQSKIRAGEFAAAQVTSNPLMLVGTVSTIAVRIDVDENDAWRVKAGAPATAMLRGNTQISFPLQFNRFEPYVIPKRSLTGESTERVDTRVLQVVFTFERKDLPVYVGQLVDAFIQAPER
jgi:RND family efflux transporter MFP subunit